MVQVNLSLEEEVDARLEELMRRTRRSKANLVSFLVDRYYEAMKRREATLRGGIQSREHILGQTTPESEKIEQG